MANVRRGSSRDRGATARPRVGRVSMKGAGRAARVAVRRPMMGQRRGAATEVRAVAVTAAAAATIADADDALRRRARRVHRGDDRAGQDQVSSSGPWVACGDGRRHDAQQQGGGPVSNVRTVVAHCGASRAPEPAPRIEVSELLFDYCGRLREGRCSCPKTAPKTRGCRVAVRRPI